MNSLIRTLILILNIFISLKITNGETKTPKYFDNGPASSLNVPTLVTSNSTVFSADILNGALSPFSYLKLTGISACGKLQTGTPLPSVCDIDLTLKCNDPSEGSMHIRGNPVMTNHGVIDVTGGSFEMNNGVNRVKGWGYGIFPYLGESSYFEITLVPTLNKRGEYVFMIFGIGYEKAHLSSDPIGINCPFSVGQVIYQNVLWAKTYIIGTSWIKNQIPFPTITTEMKNKLVELRVPSISGSSWKLGGMFLSSLHVPVNPSIHIGNTDMKIILSCPTNKNNLLISLNGTGIITLSHLTSNSTNMDLLRQFNQNNIFFQDKFPHKLYNGIVVEVVLTRSIYASSTVIYLTDYPLPNFFECSSDHIKVYVKHSNWAPLYISNYTNSCHEYGSSFKGVNLFSIPTFLSPEQCQNTCSQTVDCEFWEYNNNDNICSGYTSENYSFKRDSSTYKMITGSVSCPCYSHNVNLLTPVMNKSSSIKVSSGTVDDPAECQAMVLENYGLNAYFVYNKFKKECYKYGIVTTDTLPYYDSNTIIGPSICHDYIYAHGVSKYMNELELLQTIKINTNVTDHYGELCRAYCTVNNNCQIYELTHLYECMLFAIKNKQSLKSYYDIVEKSWPNPNVILMGVNTPLDLSYSKRGSESIIHIEVGDLSLDLKKSSGTGDHPPQVIRKGVALTSILCLITLSLLLI
ncbi:hypothetical protein RS030_132039 [Cryptosporidium xiaoi]|uniref:Apple domain-containing protein n=1 Tax=Cryptosporidium xiaoi TaxID=659607 RepID=A0AAV9Y247_9CRYT